MLTLREVVEKDLPEGKLSLVEQGNGQLPKLFLGEQELHENDVLLAKFGKGEPIGGRLFWRQGNSKRKDEPSGWYFDAEEFIGHTYLNRTLDTNTIQDMKAVKVDVPRGR